MGGSTLNETTYDGLKPLHLACWNGRFSSIETIFKGVNILKPADGVEESKTSGITFAAFNGGEISTSDNFSISKNNVLSNGYTGLFYFFFSI